MGHTLILHTAPSVPLEGDRLRPDAVRTLTAEALLRLPLMHGNEEVAVGDFFRLGPGTDADLRLEGDLSRVKLIGAEMREGTLVVAGAVGAHLGAAMTGGTIRVEGDTGDWLGAEMQGGSILVTGNAGHMVGAAYRGSPSGMHGGEIVVLGNAGNETGNGMRRGLVAIGGSAGDFVGVNLLAGTIVVCGEPGQRPGAGMRRGSIVLLRGTELLPTFAYDCCYRPLWLRLYLRPLQARGLPLLQSHLTGAWDRWSGDGIEINRGEVLVHRA